MCRCSRLKKKNSTTTQVYCWARKAQFLYLFITGTRALTVQQVRIKLFKIQNALYSGETWELGTNWFIICLDLNLQFDLPSVLLMWCATLLQCQIYVNRRIQDMPSFLFPVMTKPWKGGYEITNTASLLKHPLHPGLQWSFKFLTGLLTGMPAIPSKHGYGGRKKKTLLPSHPDVCRHQRFSHTCDRMMQSNPRCSQHIRRFALCYRCVL